MTIDGKEYLVARSMTVSDGSIEIEMVRAGLRALGEKSQGPPRRTIRFNGQELEELFRIPRKSQSG